MLSADPASIETTYPAPNRLRMTLRSHPATLAPMRKVFEAFTEKAGFNEADRGQIILVINEALANVMRHAYNGATDKPIEINATDTSESFQVDIRDWGNGKLPPANKVHDPLQPGGLGLVCLKQFMTKVSFHPEPDGMTLTMVRNKTR